MFYILLRELFQQSWPQPFRSNGESPFQKCCLQWCLGSLNPEQRVADAWNDYLQKIGAPQESFVTAADIHALRDSYHTSSQVCWARGRQNIWTVPNIYAVGADGKVANGCRALEVLNVLWQLANQPELMEGTRDLIKKGERMSDMYKDPSKPPKPGSESLP
jgi:hypothetical protein